MRFKYTFVNLPCSLTRLKIIFNRIFVKIAVIMAKSSLKIHKTSVKPRLPKYARIKKKSRARRTKQFWNKTSVAKRIVNWLRNPSPTNNNVRYYYYSDRTLILRNCQIQNVYTCTRTHTHTRMYISRTRRLYNTYEGLTRRIANRGRDTLYKRQRLACHFPPEHPSRK